MYQAQMFPQPTGNVYNINNSLEVANVPTGAGLSVALCIPENLMYVKTMQNGSPLFWTYKITPYNTSTNNAPAAEDVVPVENTSVTDLENKINTVESKLDKIIKELGVKTK